MTLLTLPHPVSHVYEAAALDRRLKDVPDPPGVYAFYADDLPEALVPFAPASAGPTTLYVGQTGDRLNLRIEHHLFRDARVSTLRGSLGLLVQDALGLELVRLPGTRQFCFTDEQPLTDWLRHHTRVAFAVSEHPSQTEAAWLAIEPGLLNIKGCPPTPLTAEIREMRRLASGRHLRLPTAPR